MSTATAHRRPAARPNPAALLDAAIAAAMLAGSLLLLSHASRVGLIPPHPAPVSGFGTGKLNLVGVVLALCSTVPLIAWRRWPLAVFVVTAAAGALMAAGLGYPIHLLLGPTAALYLLVSRRERPTRWARRAAAIIGLLVACLGAIAVARGIVAGIEPFLLTGLVWAVAWLAGERTRLRREHMAQLAERAQRLEREAERERLLAAAQERARIARDLHDSAGHAISVIAVRAGAARLRHRQDPDRSLRALEAIEELARQTAGEIDQLVGTLRDGGPATGAVEAPLGLGSLETLIARHAATGLEVGLDVSGTPRPLGAAADQAAYRIIQESLTNAARHGTGSARVELAFGDVAVEVIVTNPVPVRSTQSGGGHGLTGMRERATLLGGSLDTERADGSFRVHGRIPYRVHHDDGQHA